jgi:hypothetical protein
MSHNFEGYRKSDRRDHTLNPTSVMGYSRTIGILWGLTRYAIATATDMVVLRVVI